MADYLSKVAESIERYELLSKHDGVVLGLSGGADSVCLLIMLLELSSKYDLKLYPVHVNHMIRGEEALRDEAFCKALCEELNLNLICEHVDVPSYAANNSLSEEEAGRKLRYDIFRKVMCKKHAASIAVAHHMDDRAETYLFNLARGTKLAGLCGMNPKSGNIIRPLLVLRRAEIEAYLRERGRDYVTDSTNLEDEYSRNYIRHEIIPGFCDRINHAAVENIAAVATYSAELLDYIRSEVVRCACIEVYVDRVCIDLNKLRALHRVVASEVMVTALKSVYDEYKDITDRHIEALLSLSYGVSGKKMDLPKGCQAQRVYDKLVIYKAAYRPCETFSEYVCEVVSFEEWLTVTCGGVYDKSVFLKEDEKYFDYDKAGELPVIRHREDGDYMIIDRAGHKKKLADICTDMKVERMKRDKLVVAAIGGEVLWAIGLRGGMSALVDEDTKRVLIITKKG